MSVASEGYGAFIWDRQRHGACQEGAAERSTNVSIRYESWVGGLGYHRC